LVRHQRLSRPLRGRGAPAATEPTEETDEQAGLPGAHPSSRRAQRRDAACAGQPRRYPDFAPEPITADDVSEWSAQFLDRAGRALDELARRKSDLREEDRRAVDELLAERRSLPSRLRELLPSRIGGMKIRHHGDFHLGQMLIAKDDVFIIDFEGEPRPQPGRASAQGAGGARSRRPDPLDRLFGDGGARPRLEVSAGRTRQDRRGARRLA